MNAIKFIATYALLIGATATFGHETTGAKPHGAGPLAKEQMAWGIAGDARAVRRTIDIVADDNMSSTPSVIELREGDTVRLRGRNVGKDLHELVLGTPAGIEAHAAQMKKHPGMEHDDPWMTHVPAGKTGDVVWLLRSAPLLALASAPLGALAAPPMVEIWKDPNCGCCRDWVQHLNKSGFGTRVHDDGNTAFRARLRVPARLGSCHTALVAGYALEGHVPAREVMRLLKEKPDAVGLAVPGMPVGAARRRGPGSGRASHGQRRSAQGRPRHAEGHTAARRDRQPRASPPTRSTVRSR